MHDLSGVVLLYNAVGAVILMGAMIAINLHLRFTPGTPQGRWWSASLALFCGATSVSAIQRWQEGDYDLKWGSYVVTIAVTIGLIGYVRVMRGSD